MIDTSYPIWYLRDVFGKQNSPPSLLSLFGPDLCFWSSTDSLSVSFSTCPHVSLSVCCLCCLAAGGLCLVLGRILFCFDYALKVNQSGLRHEIHFTNTSLLSTHRFQLTAFSWWRRVGRGLPVHLLVLVPSSFSSYVSQGFGLALPDLLLSHLCLCWYPSSWTWTQLAPGDLLVPQAAGFSWICVAFPP